MKEFAQELARMKMEASFYKTWVDEKLCNLDTYTIYFTTCDKSHADEYPEWKQAWNDGQIPRLARKDDQAPVRRKAVYRSWDDYFHKQRGVVNIFLKSGEIATFCKELWWYIREIVADKRTLYILKQWHSLILDVVRSAHLAKSPFGLFYEIERLMMSFDQAIHYYWGWHHQVAPMLPDYELGKKRRENVKRWARHQRSRDINDDIENRNNKIKQAAQDIQSKCKKRKKSIREIAIELSHPPYVFQTGNGYPLSERQIRKIIS